MRLQSFTMSYYSSSSSLAMTRASKGAANGSTGSRLKGTNRPSNATAGRSLRADGVSLASSPSGTLG